MNEVATEKIYENCEKILKASGVDDSNSISEVKLAIN